MDIIRFNKLKQNTYIQLNKLNVVQIFKQNAATKITVINERKHNLTS